MPQTELVYDCVQLRKSVWFTQLWFEVIGRRSISARSSDLEMRDAMGQILLENSPSYARVVWPKMTEFGMVTQVGRKVFIKHVIRHVHIFKVGSQRV